MDTEIVEKLLSVQEVARQDGRYIELLEEYRLRDKRFLEVLPTMAADQRDAVMELMGLVFEMHLRLLTIACSHDPPQVDGICAAYSPWNRKKC